MLSLSIETAFSLVSFRRGISFARSVARMSFCFGKNFLSVFDSCVYEVCV